MTEPRPFGPVPEPDRIASLDLLRGFALLGIFMVNMQFFSMPFGEMFSPSVYRGGPVIDLIAWGITKTLFEYKFISLFSLLFGAGMIMQMTRARQRGRPFVPVYLRRMLVLFLIGLAHGFFLWYGDILSVYAALGTVLLLARKWRPRTMFITAGSIIAFFCVVQLGIGIAVFVFKDRPDTSVEQTTEVTETEDDEPWSEHNPNLAARYPWLAAMVDSRLKLTSDRWRDAETKAYKEGPLMDASAFRAFTYLVVIVVGIFGYDWRVLAMFLIGAAFMKLGVFGSGRSRWHARLFVLGFAVGLPLELANTWLMFHGMGGDRLDLAMIGAACHEAGSVSLCLGLVGAAGLIVTTGVLRRTVSAVSAVGRLALSNYLLQTVVTTFLMYWWGLGWFGDLTRPSQIALVLAIYGLQIPLSVLWLRVFTIGPMEWIWRSLTYLKPQPMRRP